MKQTTEQIKVPGPLAAAPLLQKPASRKLLITPRPYDDENLPGLLLRATEENGYEAASQLLQIAEPAMVKKTGQNFYSVLTEQHFKNFSEMLNLEVPLLKDLANIEKMEKRPYDEEWMRPDITYRFFKHSISVDLLRLDFQKICPACLCDSAYIRRAWDLVPLTTCPTHNLILVDTCPNCKKRISWNRKSVCMCKCGFDLRHVDAKTADDAGMNLAKGIYIRCGLIESRTESEIAKRPLSALDLNRLIECIYIIAAQQSKYRGLHIKSWAREYNNSELNQLLSPAVKAFYNWPMGFYSFLDQLRQIPKGNRFCTGLKKDFGGFYGQVFGQSFGYGFIRDAFEQYLKEMWDGGYLTTKYKRLPEDIRSEKFLPATAVAKLLRITPYWVQRLQAFGTLRGKMAKMGTRQLCLIEVESAHELKQRYDKSLYPWQVSGILNIERHRVSALVRAGLLKALRGPVQDGHPFWRIEKKEIEEFLKKIENKIPQTETDSHDKINFHHAVKRLSILRMNIAEFVRAIFEGEIVPYGKETSGGLNSFMFSESQILQYLKARLPKLEGVRSKRDAAKVLGLKEEVVSFLVKKSLLLANYKLGQYSYLLDQDIQKFQSKFVAAAELAISLGISPRTLVYRMEEKGIRPITGPKIDGGRQYFYKRELVNNLDLKQLLSKKKSAIPNLIRPKIKVKEPLRLFQWAKRSARNETIGRGNAA